MKAISLKQPFATLMMYGKQETRTWETMVRGEVLICASLKAYDFTTLRIITGEHQEKRILNLLDEKHHFFNHEPGHAIAVGMLIGCRKMTPQDEDDCFVKFNEGLWVHVYENVRRIVPIPFKGKQGWSDVDEETLKQIKYL